jgi:hypothetical protein
MARAPAAIAVLTLSLTLAGGTMSCGSAAAPTETGPSRSPSQAGRRFCRDVHGVLLIALNAAADDRTTDPEALTLFGTARDEFARDARLDDARVATMSRQIVRGLDGFIGVVRSKGLAEAIDQHHDAFGGAALEVDRFCG